MDHRELLAILHVGAVLHPAHKVADVLDHIGAARPDHAEARMDAVAAIAVDAADGQRELQGHSTRPLRAHALRGQSGLLRPVEVIGEHGGCGQVAHGVEPVPAVGMGRIVVAQRDRVLAGTRVGLGCRAIAAK